MAKQGLFSSSKIQPKTMEDLAAKRENVVAMDHRADVANINFSNLNLGIEP